MSAGERQSLGDGIVLVPARAAAPVRLTTDGSAELDPAARWTVVQRELGRHGRSAPVLPAFLDATVGGTLSVGGYGIRSISRGNQLDHVERVRLLRPDGTRVWCSAGEQPELFALALGSLGQLGLIDRVTMRTMPHRTATVFRRELGSFSALADWLGEPPAADSFFSFSDRRALQAGAVAAQVGIDDGCDDAPPPRATRTAEGYDVDAVLDRDVRTWLGQHPRDARLFADVIVDRAGLVALARWLDAQARRAPALEAVYVLASRNGHRFPFDGRFGPERLLFGVGLYAFAPRADPALLASADALLRELLDRCLEAGGRPFLWGWQRLPEPALAAIYGNAYERLRARRAACDPHGLVNRGALNGPP